MKKHAVKSLLLTCALIVPSAIGARCSDVAIESISAKSAILIEASSGDAVFEKDADQRLPMASTTKIMTALVALSECDIDKTVNIPSEAVGTEGSSIYLAENEQLSMRDLLYAMLLESANDAAAAIAVDIAGGIDEFADLMNIKAHELGLSNTHFSNPHGLDDDDHYTSARDLAHLTAAALENRDFAEIVSTYKTTIQRSGEERLIVNHNRLLRTYESAIGVKTGFTQKSGRCLVSAAERDGVRMIAVTLNAPDDWNDHRIMLDYGFSEFECLSLSNVGEISVKLPVFGGTESYVRCTNTESLSLVLPKGSHVTRKIEGERYVASPVKAGDALAKAVFICRGKTVAEIPLYAEEDVDSKENGTSFLERLADFILR